MKVVIFGNDIVGTEQFLDYLMDTDVEIAIVENEAAALAAVIAPPADTTLIINSVARPTLPKDIWLQLVDRLVITNATTPTRILLSRCVRSDYLGYIINVTGANLLLTTALPTTQGLAIINRDVVTLLPQEVLMYDPTSPSLLCFDISRFSFPYWWVVITLTLLALAIICLIIWGIVKLVRKRKQQKAANSCCYTSSSSSSDSNSSNCSYGTVTREIGVQTSCCATDSLPLPATPSCPPVTVSVTEPTTVLVTELPAVPLLPPPLPLVVAIPSAPPLVETRLLEPPTLVVSKSLPVVCNNNNNNNNMVASPPSYNQVMAQATAITNNAAINWASFG